MSTPRQTLCSQERKADELLRRAHNRLVYKVDASGVPIAINYLDAGDREACNLLWKLHVDYFL